MPLDTPFPTGEYAALRGEKLTEDAPEDKWPLRVRALFVMTASLILLVAIVLESSRSHGLTANKTTANAQLGALSEQLQDPPKEISPTRDPKPSNEQAAAPQLLELEESREASSGNFRIDDKESAKSDEPNISPPGSDIELQSRFFTHLASLRTEQQARRERARLMLKFPTQLENLNLMIERVELGSQGIFYRVLTDLAQDRFSARRLCASLQTVNQYCSVLKSETASVL